MAYERLGANALHFFQKQTVQAKIKVLMLQVSSPNKPRPDILSLFYLIGLQGKYYKWVWSIWKTHEPMNDALRKPSTH